MIMREKIVDICDNEMISTSPSCYSLADAIITALPDMIKPLEWYRGYYSGVEIAKSLGWCYNLEVTHGQVSVAFIAKEHFKVLYRGKDKEAAIEAANAHNVATIMGAFE